MKKYILTAILAAFCLTCSAQPNAKFLELDNYLKELGIFSFYSQCNYGEGIRHEVSASLYVNQFYSKGMSELTREMKLESDSIMYRPNVIAIDSIRRTFSALSATASESYLYEFHQGDRDTIEYSIAFAKATGDSLQSYKHYNAMAFRNVREVGRLTFRKNILDKNFVGTIGMGRYSHWHYEDNPLSWKELKPFDGEAFQQVIKPLFKRALKTKGVKSYPIYWRHDEGYNDDTEGDIMTKAKWVVEDSEENKPFGLTTGTHYVFPKEQEALALEVLHDLDSIAFAYVNAHPEQLYSYHKYTKYYTGSWATLLEGAVYRRYKEQVYELHTFLDDDGFHIVSITTIGNMWMPKDWKRLKSWTNGKRVYLHTKQ